MDQRNVTKLLKNYPQYKYAVRNYDETAESRHYLQATRYSDMPRGGDGYGPKVPGGYGVSFKDNMDYHAYTRAVKMVEGALDTLTDEERSVIKLKWMDDLTLGQIANRKNYSKDTIKRTHRRAMEKLNICFRFADIPEIEDMHLSAPFLHPSA